MRIVLSVKLQWNPFPVLPEAVGSHAVEQRRHLRIIQTFLRDIQGKVPGIEGFQIRKDFFPEHSRKGFKFRYVLMGKSCL